MEWVKRMNRQIVIKKELLDSAICMEYTMLDGGIHVLLTSERYGHVGAISHIEEGMELQTIQFPGHKDAVVSDMWASWLYEKMQCPITVCCGIHYDDITKEQIGQVVDCTNELLGELLSKEI